MSENCAAETFAAECTADRATGCGWESADLALAGAFVVALVGAFVVALVGAFVVAPANLGRASVGRLEVAPLLALGLLVAPITMNSVKNAATLLMMMGCLRIRFKGFAWLVVVCDPAAGVRRSSALSAGPGDLKATVPRRRSASRSHAALAAFQTRRFPGNFT
jgi:hypothetical protein